MAGRAFRLLLLDPCRTARDRQRWMERILAGQTAPRQARLVYLLYGPRTQGERQALAAAPSRETEVCFSG